MAQSHNAAVIDGGLTDNIKIDFSAIPDFVREDLAATTLDCVQAFLRQPGGKEMLDARIVAKKKERSKTNENRKDTARDGDRA